MYAVIESGGKQYRVSEGELIRVEKLAGEVGDEVIIDRVLSVRTDGELIVGSPYVKGAKVIAKIEEQGRHRKVITFKYRRRKDTHRKVGHRQRFTGLRIEKIVYEG